MHADVDKPAIAPHRRPTELVEVPRTNLRRDSLGFVGRGAELAAVRRLLDEGRRIVTITGPPGVGKTRLCRQLGEHWLSGDWPREGEIWFADLSETREIDALITTVSDLFDLPLTECPEVDAALARLGDAMRHRGPLLLICDNVEQVVEPAAAAFSSWLGVADRLQLLVTSRERLALSEEVVVELGALSVPGVGPVDVDSVRGSEAGQLFEERAGAVRPDYRVTDADAGAVAALVDRLDGVPLTIELAAARMSLLSPAQLLTRLEKRLQVLARGHRAAPARHATLEAAITWSWDLLEPWEQSALAQCAVFRRGFDVEAAEAVIDLSRHRDAPAVLDVLQSLRDKSLVARDPAEPSDRELRFRLLESIRAYAAARLDETTLGAATLDRHAAHYARAGERWAREADGRDGVSALRRLPVERDNLQAAFDRLLYRVDSAAEEHGVPGLDDRTAEMVLGLAIALDLLLLQGPRSEHLRTLDAALALTKRAGGAPGDRVVEVMLRVAGVQIKGGRLEDAVGTLTEARDLARREGHRSLEGHALNRLAAAQLGMGEQAEARASAEQALAIGEAQADDKLIGRGQLTLSSLAAHSGAFDETRRRLLKALRAFRLGDDQVGELWTLTHLGDLFMELGLPSKARDVLLEGLAIARRRVHRMSEGCILQELGRCHLVLGRADEAKSFAVEALRVHREIGYVSQEGITLGHLGAIDLERGEPLRAVEHLEEAVAVLEGAFPASAAQFLPALADAQAALGRHRQAQSSLTRALEVAGEAGHAETTALLGAKLGAFHASVGAIEKAREIFEVCDDSSVRAKGSAVQLSIALYRAHLEVAPLEPGEIGGRQKAKVQARRDAVHLLASALEPGPLDEEHPWGAPPAVFRWYHVDVAARSLERLLSPRERAQAQAEAIDPDRTSVIVSADGCWVRGPGAEWEDLTAKPQLATCLALLVDRRRRDPTRPATPDELRDALWPGEKMLPEAFTNRLHKTIATIRKLGLRQTLKRDDEGYFLDLSVPLVVMRDVD